MCPNKDQNDKYPGQLPIDPELEATFKRLVIKPLEITEAVIAEQVTSQNQPDVLEQEVNQPNKPDVQAEEVTPQNQPGILAKELTPTTRPQPAQVMQQGIGVEYGQGGEAVFGQNLDAQLPTGLIQVNPIQHEILQQENLDPSQLLLAMSEGNIVGAQPVMDKDDDDEERMEV